jgi:hypothetical protein
MHTKSDGFSGQVSQIFGGGRVMVGLKEYKKRLEK